jgi:hypothetical protein
MLEDMMIDSDKQGLTEAWLAEEFGWDKPTPLPPYGTHTHMCVLFVT